MSERTFRVLIVDDSPTARMALRAALETDPAISVVGEAGDSVQALRLTRRLRPDLVTVDNARKGLHLSRLNLRAA